MRKIKHTSTQDCYNHCNPIQQAIIDDLRKIFHKHQAKEVLQRNSLVYKFPNKSWCYIDIYKKEHLILGFGRGKKLVDQNPMLAVLFDETKAVVAKMHLHSVDDIAKKAVKEVITLTAHSKK